MQGSDFVFHLAANADVRHGPDHPDRDLQQNTHATFNVLEAMRRAGVRRIAFASTGIGVRRARACFPHLKTRRSPFRPRFTPRQSWQAKD